MATRMQQRRGTAAQWTSANPILNAGEIGWESDTNKFKIGDGVNHWADLDYFIDSSSTVNPQFGTSIVFEGATADAYETTLAVTDPTADRTITLPDASGTVALTSDITAIVDGAPGLLDTLNELAAAINDDANFASTITTEIATRLPKTGGTMTGAIDMGTNAITNLPTPSAADAAATKGYVDTALGSYATTSGPTFTGTVNLPETTNIGDVSSTELSYVNGVTSAIQTQLDAKANTTGGATFTGTIVLPSTTSIGDVSDTELSYVNGVTSAIQTQLDAKAPSSEPTFTGTVTLPGTTSIGDVSSTELGYVNGVTSAIQTQLDGKSNTGHTHAQSDITDLTTDLAAKADLASPTFTGTVNAADLIISGDLTVSGTTTTVSTSDLVVTDPLIYIGEGNNANLVDVGVVGSFDDGTYQHTGLVRDASASKWKLFKGVTDEPTTTINFTQGSLDALAVGALEATTITPSSGIVFSDGTQTKEGVASITTIVQQSASYNLSTGGLTLRDNLLELGSASAITLTIPANSTTAYPVGTAIDILQTGAGQVTVAGAAGVTVNATPGLKLRAQWSSATLFKRATDTWVLIGDLSA